MQRFRLPLFVLHLVQGIDPGEVQIFDKYVGIGETGCVKKYQNAPEATESCQAARWRRPAGFFVSHRDFLNDHDARFVAKRSYRLRLPFGVNRAAAHISTKKRSTPAIQRLLTPCKARAAGLSRPDA